MCQRGSGKFRWLSVGVAAVSIVAASGWGGCGPSPPVASTRDDASEPLERLLGASPNTPTLSSNGIVFSQQVSGGITITQDVVPTASVDAGVAGVTMRIKAQSGEATTRDGGAGSVGGTMRVASGSPGAAGNGGVAGAPGVLFLSLDDADVFEIATTTLMEPVVPNALNLGSVADPLNAAYAGWNGFVSTFDAGETNQAQTWIHGVTFSNNGNWPSTNLPMLSFSTGFSPVTNGMGDMNIVDGYSELCTTDYNSNISECYSAHNGGYLDLGLLSIHIQPNIGGNTANGAFVFDYAQSLASVASAPGAGGSMTFTGQPGQATSGNIAAGAGGAYSETAGAGGVSTGTTGASVGGAGGQYSSAGGIGGVSGKDGIGGAGGADSHGGGAGGGTSATVDAGGAGGAEIIYSGAGGIGHGTTGAPGVLEMLVGGPVGTGSIVAEWSSQGPADPIAYPTFSASANTTLTSAQIEKRVIDLATVTTSANVNLVWPALTNFAYGGPWWVDLSAITLGSTDTITMQASGGATCAAISTITNSANGLVMVRIKGDGGISCGN